MFSSLADSREALQRSRASENLPFRVLGLVGKWFAFSLFYILRPRALAEAACMLSLQEL